MYCNRCGAQNPDDAHFCAKCGAAVAANIASRPAAASPPPAPAPHSEAAPPRRAAPAPFDPRGFVFPTLSLSDIIDLPSARAHTMAGFIAALAGVVFSLFASKVLGSLMFGVAALYAVIAYGLWRSSRAAAVVGLLLSTSNAIGTVALTKGNATKLMLLLVVLFVIAYWNAVRGTFAEHRIAGTMPRGAVKTA